MTYLYACAKCDVEFDVVKSVKDIDREEKCESCGNVCERQFSANVHFIGTSVESPEFNHGLGMVIKNKKHRADEAKARGLVEIGNELPKKTRERLAKQREEKRKRRMDEI